MDIFKQTLSEIQKEVNSKLEEHVINLLEETEDMILSEAIARKTIRVNSRGQRTKKLLCKKGFRKKGKVCVPATSSDKAKKKISIRKANKTKKADQAGQKKAIKRRKLALRKRRSQGLK